MEAPILYLDIETVPFTNDFNTLNNRLRENWSRKAGFLRTDVFETDEKLYNLKAGIFAEFGRIVCISIGMMKGDKLRIKSFFNHNEKELLLEFCELVNKLPDSVKLCAHNGKEFDYPYICRRLLINQLTIPKCLNISGKKPWEINHLDTLELWKFGDYKHYTSLDLLATVFDIPTSKDDIDGSQVADVYYNEELGLERIKTYCEKDVAVLANVHRSLSQQPKIEIKDIEYV